METKKIKILAIDDNPDNIISIKALIMEAYPDALILTALNGPRGLELATAEEPDVILLDIVMPNMDGFEVCQKLKDDKKTSEIPVVFVTAIKGDKASRIKALDVGADAFLAKPIDESELVAQIRAMVKIRTANLEKQNESLRLSALVEERTRELNENYISTVNLFEDLNRENTRRKETENALIESQERYRTLIENSSEAIYVIQNEKFVFANPACAQISGTSADELLGKSVLDFVAVDQKDKIRKQHIDLSEGLVQNNNGTYSIRKPQGELAWLIINSVRIIWNELPASLNFASDITERKRAEEALIESENKYRTLIQYSSDPIFSYNPDETYRFVNDAFTRVFGKTPDDFIGKNPHAMFSFEEAETRLSIVRKVFKTGDKAEDEVCLTDANNEVSYMITMADPIKDSQGNVLYVTCISKDITERKKAEIALRESEEKFREMANLLPQIVFEIDLNGLLTYINDQSYTILGYKNTELLGKKSTTVHIPEERDRVSKLLQSKTAWKEVVDNEYTMLRKDGTTFTALIYTNGILKDNNFVGVRGIIVDITERKLAEDKLRESESKFFDLYSLMRSMSDTMSDMMWAKNLNNEYIFSNEAFSKRILNAVDTQEPIGKTDIFFAQRERDSHPDDPTWHTFGEICADTDVITLQKMKQMQFDEYGNVKGKFVFLDVNKAPLYNDKRELIGVVGSARDITDRKRVEEELITSELKYRELMENSPEGITIYVDGKIAYINKEATRLMRAKDKSELLGKSIVDYINPENRELVLERMKYVALAPINVALPEVEEIYTRLDGTEVYVEIKVMPIIFDNKFAIQISGHDITDRIEAQKKIKQSELFLKETQKIARLGSYSLSFETNKWTSSEVLNEIFGIPDDFNKSVDSWISIIHPDWQETMSKYLVEEVVGKRIKFDKTYQIVRQSDQEVRWVHGIGELQFDMNNQVVNMIGSIQDITELAQAQKALIASEEKFREMADLLPQVVYEFDTEGKITYLNQQIYKLCGYEKVDSLVGKSIFDFYDPKDKERSKVNANRRIAGEDFGYSEYNLLRKDGTSFPVLSYANRIIKDKRTIGLRGVIIDISEQKKIQLALEQSRNELKAIYDNAPVVMCVLDEDRNILFANNAFKEYSQVLNDAAGFDQAFGGVLGCLNSLDNPKGCGYGKECKNCALRIAIAETFRTEKVHTNIEFNTKIIRNDVLIDISLLGSVAIIYSNGQKAIQVSLIDISKRKQAEDAMQKSEMFLRTFIENTPFEIWARDVNNVGILENKKMVDHFGSILGKTSNDFSILHPDTVKVWDKNNKRVLEGELVDEIVEYEIDNKVYSYQQIIFPIYNNETIIGISGFNIDISDRKRMESELMETQLLYHSFLEQLPVAVFRKDKEGRFVLVNSHFCKLKGITKDDFLGYTAKEVANFELKNKGENGIATKYALSGEDDHKEIIKTGKILEVEEEYSTPDGMLYLHVLKMPVFDSNGSVVGSQGIMFDISERKLIEIALNNSEEQLKKFASHLQNVREDEKIALAREIHDDLGQILVALKIDMGLLKQKVVKSNTFVSDDILTKFDKLVDLIDTTIKTARRIMSGLRPEQLDLLGFVEATRQYLLEFENRYKIRCEFVSSISELNINSQQAVALFRIVQEALNNIVKHAKARKVEVSVSKMENRLTLLIIDNGVGFDVNNSGRTDSYGMIGMKERVFLLDGDIRISSQLGTGTTITVEMPYETDHTTQNKTDQFFPELPF